MFNMSLLISAHSGVPVVSRYTSKSIVATALHPPTQSAQHFEPRHFRTFAGFRFCRALNWDGGWSRSHAEQYMINHHPFIASAIFSFFSYRWNVSHARIRWIGQTTSGTDRGAPHRYRRTRKFTHWICGRSAFGVWTILRRQFRGNYKTRTIRGPRINVVDTIFPHVGRFERVRHLLSNLFLLVQKWTISWFYSTKWWWTW